MTTLPTTKFRATRTTATACAIAIAMLLTTHGAASPAPSIHGAAASGAAMGDSFNAFNKVRQIQLFQTLDEAIATEAEGYLTEEFAAIRKAELHLQTKLGGRKGAFGVNVIGSFTDAEHHAAGWQARVYGGDDDTRGVNGGVFYRQHKGNAIYGVNAFADFEDGDYGNFLRYGVGAEAGNTLFGINANFYLPETEAREVSPGKRAYSRRGFDVNLRINIPNHNYMKLRTDYYKFGGKFNQEADVGFRYGIELALPEFNWLKIGVLYDGGDDKFGGDLTYTHTLGTPTQSSTYTQTNNTPDLHTPAPREYSQRIKL